MAWNQSLQQSDAAPSGSLREELFHQNYLCPVCNNTVEDDASIVSSIACDGTCQRIFHLQCANLTEMQFNHYNIHTEERWLCVFCQNTQQQENAHTEQLAMEVLNEETEDAANEQTAPLPSFQPANIGNNQSRTRMEWGCLRGFENINEALDYAYSEIVKWKKNFFQVPFGSVGKALVEETTRLLELFNARSDWEALALKALMVLLPLMIQKPAKNSKSRDHVKHLRRRLEMWKSGAIRGLVGECKEIQKRFAPSISAPKKNMTKLFYKSHTTRKSWSCL